MTTVTIETVRKVMEKVQRTVFYVKDDKGELLWSQEDEEKPITESFAELESVIEDASGNYAIVELPEAPKGKGRKGGFVHNSKYVYRIRLASGKNNDGGGNIGGNLGLIMQLMERNQALAIENQKQQFQFTLDAINDKLKKKEKDSDNDPVKLFAEIVGDKIIEGRKAEKAFKKAIAKEPTHEEAGAMAEETPSPKKKKILDAIATFKEIDPEGCADNLAFLAEYAAKNPGIYKAFIANLKNPEA